MFAVVFQPKHHGALKCHDPKRLSTELSQSQAVPLLTPSSHIPSIPPSPLKPEFTSTPPFGIMRTQPVLNAARELQFDNPPDLSDISPQEAMTANQSGVNFKQVVKPVQLDLSSKEHVIPELSTQSSTQSEAKFSLSSVDGELTDSFSRSASVGESDPRDNSGAAHSETVSIDNLSQVIESLENEGGESNRVGGNQKRS